MTLTAWFIVAGGVLCGMALTATLIKRLPLTTALVYLPLGWILGSRWVSAIHLDMSHDAAAIQIIAQISILISLFSAGLKVRLPLGDHLWKLAFRMAFLAMALTILLIAAGAVFFFHVSWGLGILVGAILAPTDPVLASDVEVESPYQQTPLRFLLTSEAGLNDGTAYPFFVLGILLLQHPAGPGLLLRWALLSLVWGSVGGLGIGWCVGYLMGRYILHLRREHQQAIGLGYFIAPGLIGISYGLGELAHAFGFLSVFACAVALRSLERRETGDEGPPELPLLAADPSVVRKAASDPERASVFLIELLLQFTDQLEQIGEIVVVVIVGALLRFAPLAASTIGAALVIFFIIRPAGTMIGLARSKLGLPVKALTSWFGIRGIASLYYLATAVVSGLPSSQVGHVTRLVIIVVAMSIILHGASVTPLMNLYSGRWERSSVEDLEKAA